MLNFSRQLAVVLQVPLLRQRKYRSAAGAGSADVIYCGEFANYPGHAHSGGDTRNRRHGANRPALALADRQVFGPQWHAQ